MTKEYLRRQFQNFKNVLLDATYATKAELENIDIGDIDLTGYAKTEDLDNYVENERTTNISNENLWTVGVISANGALVNNNARITSGYIEIENDLQFHNTNDNYEYALCLYNSSMQILRNTVYYNPTTKTLVDSAIYTQRDITGAELISSVPDATYCRIILRNTDTTSQMTTTMFDNLSITSVSSVNNDLEYLDECKTTYSLANGVIILTNAINSLANIWTRWSSRLAFGMNTNTARVPVEIDGQLYTNGTIIAHNTGTKNNNRWGFHLFEGYAKDNYSRLTVLVDKHNTEFNNKPSLECYYYTGADHKATSYGTTKIGSDVAGHSFAFDRDVFTCAGLADFKSPITLAKIDTSQLDDTYTTVSDLDNAIDAENNPTEHSNALKHVFLVNAENGTMFYDSNRDKVVCKIANKWCDLPFSDASSNYDF